MAYHTTTDMDEEDLERSRSHPFNRLTTLLKDNMLTRFVARHMNGQYRPEKHYMRGPGPKTKAKYDANAPADASSPKTIRPIR